MTINSSVWTQWSHYCINVREPLQSGKAAEVKSKTSADKTEKGVGMWNGKALLPNGPAVFIDSFTLDKSQLLDTFVRECK